jgi:HD-like signal output (HDOD) protein
MWFRFHLANAHMPIDPALRSLDLDIPSKPQSLVQLSLLMAEDDLNLGEAADLIESDMALASAVLRAVNSSLYGLRSRVQSVHQAITYLGVREVSGITFEMGLRAAFPAARELDPIWQRAGWRGLLMGRLATMLSQDAWASHSAGLFQECGKAVLFRHAPDRYRELLRKAQDDVDLAAKEHEAFGVSHDALGAALCESWGLGQSAVSSVRHHVQALAAAKVPPHLTHPQVLTISLLISLMQTDPGDLEQTVPVLAPQGFLEPALVLRSLRRLQEHVTAAQQRSAVTA